jgi:hypothetical protein
MHDPQRTLESLKALRHERGDTSPFATHTEFLRWADQAAPLLAFEPELAEAFKSSASAATTVRTWKPEKYVPAINNAIGTVNRAITLLEHVQPTTAAAEELKAPAEVPNATEPKVTLKWLFEHATWQVYTSLLGALAVAFGLGRELGKLETQIQTSSLSKPAPTTTTPTDTMNNSKEPTKLEVKSHIASAPK